MKIKANLTIQEFKTAELKVNDLDFLAYVNANGGRPSYDQPQYASLEQIKADGDFSWWLREYLEERVFQAGRVLVGVPLSPAGETRYIVDDTRII